MAAESRNTGGDVGAYGLRLQNVERARLLLVEAPAEWPRLRIRRRIGRSTARHDTLSDRAARLKLHSGGEILVDRGKALATFTLPHRVRTAELVHPLLAPAAAVVSYWLGRECFHASGFVARQRVWGLVGERGSGKSTTVAQLAIAGIGIACDDLLVVDGSDGFAGPRSIDLRRESAEHLGVGEGLGVVGARERWRLRVGPIPSRLALAGWIFLTWGERIEVAQLGPSERLARLTAGRAVRVPPRDPAMLLNLAALPAWELRRPEGWASLPGAVECLLETVG
jgi:hypothetical protein